MRKFCGFASMLILFAIANGSAQTKIRLDSPEYNRLKKEGKLTDKMVLKADKSNPINAADIFLSKQGNGTLQTNSFNAICQCLMTVDATWQVVPFTDFSVTPPDYRNDDESSPLINLPFSFNFYGQTYNSVFINNNGNITFDQAVGSYSAGGYPAGTDTVMIAPFWADVDTRLRVPPDGPSSGLVYYKITPTYMVVQWDAVGYFGAFATGIDTAGAHTDKVNTFQLIITDGLDPILPAGNNVDFCYGDMNWTTGDASPFGNIGGFGGVSATVGANAGNGTDYIQVGRFNANGTAYDGPFGANDGVDFLDGQNFIFNTYTIGSSNITPIIHGLLVCDTITICSTSSNFADTIPIKLDFLSPEQNQITTIVATFTGSGIFNIINNTPGATAHLDAEIILTSQSIGVSTLNLIATDSYSPPGITNLTVVFKIDTFALTVPTITGPNYYCNVPGATGVWLHAPNNYLGYLWSELTTGVDSLNVLTGTYNVELTDDQGCKAKTPAFPVWAVDINPIIGGITAFCGTDSAHLETTQNFSHYQWLLAGTPTNDTTEVLSLGQGSNGDYSVTVIDNLSGCVATSPVINVDLHNYPQAQFNFSPFNVFGGDTIKFYDVSTPGSGIINGWFWDFGDTGTNSTSTLQNPSHVYDSAGVYNVSLFVTQNDGCTNMYTRTYSVVSDEIEASNVFTPNKDGINDFFEFPNLEYFPNSLLQVFNRWGKKIYENSNYDNKWDGGDSKEGVYYYILKIPEKEVKKGTVTILRAAK